MMMSMGVADEPIISGISSQNCEHSIFKNYLSYET